MIKPAKIGRPAAVQVLRAGDEHDAAVAEFFRATWDPRATAESVRRSRCSAAAANPVRPGEEPPSFIFLQDDRVLGYVGTIPIRVWSGSEERPAHWIKGLMVLPEFRNGPIGFSLLKEAVRNLNCSMALAVLPVVVGLFERLGFSDLGTLPNLVRVLRPARVFGQVNLAEIGFSGLPRWIGRAVALSQRMGLASAAGICAGALSRARIALHAGFPRSLAVDRTLPQPSEMDALWLRARKTFPASLVRDGRYLNWRYPHPESGPYRFVTVREGRETVSLAVVRRPRPNGDPRLRGIAVATISEWIFPLDRPQSGLAALAGAERIARDFGADALLCSASHPRALSLLRRRHYLKAPANVHLLVREPAGDRSLPNMSAGWWITRGDSDADEVF
ncbi:MAG TPA: GNAT family N-acetyltransferase [Patescibacteria group bacterium]|nr:GNAT family N-acetyltransferase [Patescibacteria group bacterium]